jgi:hypothetical protein
MRDGCAFENERFNQRFEIMGERSYFAYLRGEFAERWYQYATFHPIIPESGRLSVILMSSFRCRSGSFSS